MPRGLNSRSFERTINWQTPWRIHTEVFKQREGGGGAGGFEGGLIFRGQVATNAQPQHVPLVVVVVVAVIVAVIVHRSPERRIPLGSVAIRNVEAAAVCGGRDSPALLRSLQQPLGLLAPGGVRRLRACIFTRTRKRLSERKRAVQGRLANVEARTLAEVPSPANASA